MVEAVWQVGEHEDQAQRYHGFRCSAELIGHAVWLYHCFSLSLCEVELIRAQRGIVVR